jgi:hypothetical protein
MVSFARQQSSNEQDVKALDLPSLSETELLRAHALLAIGVVGCIYAPEVISFLSLGQQCGSANIMPTQHNLHWNHRQLSLASLQARPAWWHIGLVKQALVPLAIWYQPLVPSV